MLKQSFYFSEHNLNYTVIVNRIELKEQKPSLDQLFDILEKLQNKYQDSIIQFFNPRYLVNDDHLFYAIYFTLKAFRYKQNISNKSSIELLLYLSTNRQIKKAIDSFGITKYDIHQGILNYCLATDETTALKIKAQLLDNFNCVEKKNEYNKKSKKKYSRLKAFFDLSDNQINTSLHSLGVKNTLDPNKTENLKLLFQALSDLIVERMALLSLENY
jgi:tRNA threonylcarbamoyladenosine modification (KEOPS) complex Cgi121 subunit